MCPTLPRWEKSDDGSHVQERVVGHWSSLPRCNQHSRCQWPWCIAWKSTWSRVLGTTVWPRWERGERGEGVRRCETWCQSIYTCSVILTIRSWIHFHHLAQQSRRFEQDQSRIPWGRNLHWEEGCLVSSHDGLHRQSAWPWEHARFGRQNIELAKQERNQHYKLRPVVFFVLLYLLTVILRQLLTSNYTVKIRLHEFLN